MSDTPRTDAEEFYPHDSQNKVCYASFCRQLERELNAANERIKRLEEAGDRLAYWFDPREQKHFDALEDWRKAKEAKP